MASLSLGLGGMLAVPDRVSAQGWPQGGGGSTRGGESSRATAQQLFASGQRAFAAGRFSQAAQMFSRAYAHFPRAATLYNLALAQRAQQQWEPAARTLERLQTAHGENGPWAEPVRQLWEDLRTHLSSVRLEKRATSQATMAWIDERPLPLGSPGVPRVLVHWLAPGTHTLRIREQRWRFDLEPREQFDLTLPVDPVQAPPKSTKDDSSLLNSPVFWAVLSVVVVAGVGTGVYLATQADVGAAP